MPKHSKKDLEEMLKEQISENRELEQRLLDIEARMQTMARNSGWYLTQGPSIYACPPNPSVTPTCVNSVLE
jgi:hypothetical protein